MKNAFLIGLLLWASNIRGADSNSESVAKAGAKYCSEAGAFMSPEFIRRNNFSPEATKSLLSEFNVYRSLCSKDGKFTGRTSFKVPESIAINFQSIGESWTNLGRILEIAHAKESALVLLNVQQISSKLKSFRNEVETTFSGEFYKGMKSKGMSNDDIKKKLTELLATANELNRGDRKRSEAATAPAAHGI